MGITSRMLVAAFCCLLAAGCSTGPSDQVSSLMQQNQDLQARLEASDSKLRQAPDPAQLAAAQAAIADRDKQIADLQSRPQPQLASMTTVVPDTTAPKSIAGLETSVDKRTGNVTVTLPGDVLFDSGKADLKPSAQDTLDKVAKALRSDYASKKLRVEGHTDSDPITKTKDDWEDNLDLSMARAAAVTRYLEQQGIASKLVTTSGFGSSHPRSSVKSKNRRVEIVVVMR
jgi:outer membrane protein OmpA-like peptidoglycan-associated protein